MLLRKRWEANQAVKTTTIEDGRTQKEADHTAETEEEGKKDTGVEEGGVYSKS